MKKILVTGGAGYIGSHTVVELFVAGYIPVIVDNFSNSERWVIDRIAEISGQTPILHEGDCTDADFLRGVFQAEGQIDGVIHFAAFKAVGESIDNPAKYYGNNLGSLKVLLQVMAESGCDRLVFSSSATVYGEAAAPVSEEAPRQSATSPYGETKVMCEDIIRDAVQGKASLAAVALRYFNPVGAHESGLIGELPIGVPSNLVPFITQTAAGIRDQLTIFGDDYDTADGTCIRDFIHVVDLAKAHVAALGYLTEQTEPFYDVFNVGTGKGTSVRELVDTFTRINGVAVPHTVGARREGDIIVSYAAVDKAYEAMGWKAALSVDQALKDAWRWQQTLPT